MNSEQLIEKAKESIDKSITQKAQAYALIAIAQELREMNNRENHIYANQHPDNRGIDTGK